ncbi:hypothetical protein Rs2_38599 [Raphanus sativus]|nr:hypothetical protein Rs2_38599 [Raphanus sativus]
MNGVNPDDPFFDLPDGVVFLPHMLSPRSRQLLYDSDDDSDEETGQPPHLRQSNAPSGNETTRLSAEEPFDPFFDLPDGVVFHPHMLSPRSRQQLYDSDDDSDEETGRSTHLRQSNAPSGNEATRVNAHFTQSNDRSGNETTRVYAPPEEEEEVDDCPYIGTYGEYGTEYDSDGYEIEDHTNPYYSDDY